MTSPSEILAPDPLPFHYGPVYTPRPPLGDSLAACRPGPHDCGCLTTTKSWVSCEQCKQTEAYRNGQ